MSGFQRQRFGHSLTQVMPSTSSFNAPYVSFHQRQRSTSRSPGLCPPPAARARSASPPAGVPPLPSPSRASAGPTTAGPPSTCNGRSGTRSNLHSQALDVTEFFGTTKNNVADLTAGTASHHSAPCSLHVPSELPRRATGNQSLLLSLATLLHVFK